MKKLISVLFCLVLAFSFSFGAYADDGATEKNICYNKPVTVSTRYEFPQVYIHNVVDGKTYTRSSTDTQDLYGDNQWFRVDLCATYTVSEVLIDAVTPAGGVAKSIAVDESDKEITTHDDISFNVALTTHIWSLQPV